MNIKFYGTRGSIPVSDKRVKKYGGNTTCLYIYTNKDAVIIDAGTGIRDIGANLLKKKRTQITMFLTHYHWDHIQGFPFFAPIFNKNSVIEIYGPSKEITAKKALTYQMKSPFFPTSLASLPARIVFKEIKDPFQIGTLDIRTIVNNHPNYTLGLKFTDAKKSFVFMTDNELFAKDKQTSFKSFVKFVAGADLLIHDAQYSDEIYKTRNGWGHSTYSQTMRLARESGVKNIIFTHHDPFSSDNFIDETIYDIQAEYPDYNIEGAAPGKVIKL